MARVTHERVDNGSLAHTIEKRLEEGWKVQAVVPATYEQHVTIEAGKPAMWNDKVYRVTEHRIILSKEDE